MFASDDWLGVKGRRIDFIMQRRGLNQSQLAEMVRRITGRDDFNQSSVSRIISGGIDMTDEIEAAICEALQLERSLLLLDPRITDEELLTISKLQGDDLRAMVDFAKALAADDPAAHRFKRKLTNK